MSHEPVEPFPGRNLGRADLKIIGPHFHLTRILTKVQLPKSLNSRLHKDVPETWVGLSCDKYCKSFVSCVMIKNDIAQAPPYSLDSMQSSDIISYPHPLY